MQVNSFSKVYHALNMAVSVLKSFKVPDADAYKFAAFISELESALKTPRRNCDVGTAEEQSVRMAEFCRAQYKKTDGVRLCSGCRFFELAGTECQFAWAQMPYEEGGEK